MRAASITVAAAPVSMKVAAINCREISISFLRENGIPEAVGYFAPFLQAHTEGPAGRRG